MKVYKVKQVAEIVGLSKKEVKSILLDMQVITGSWAIREARGLVVELNVLRGYVTLTTPFITENGIHLLREIAEARETNQLGEVGYA